MVGPGNCSNIVLVDKDKLVKGALIKDSGTFNSTSTVFYALTPALT